MCIFYVFYTSVATSSTHLQYATRANDRAVHDTTRGPQDLSLYAVWCEKEQQGDSGRANPTGASIHRDRDASAFAQAPAHKQLDVFRQVINKQTHLLLGISLQLLHLQSQRRILCGQDAHLFLCIAEMQTCASVTRAKTMPKKANKYLMLLLQRSQLLANTLCCWGKVRLLLRNLPCRSLHPAGRTASFPFPVLHACSVSPGFQKKMFKKKTVEFVHRKRLSTFFSAPPFQETRAWTQAGTLSSLQVQLRAPLQTRSPHPKSQ
jgi:hypothetical protein